MDKRLEMEHSSDKPNKKIIGGPVSPQQLNLNKAQTEVNKKNEQRSESPMRKVNTEPGPALRRSDNMGSPTRRARDLIEEALRRK